MDPERWQQVKALLDEVLDLPLEKRGKLLEDCRSEDPALVEAVESLVAAHERARTFLENGPPLSNTATSLGKTLPNAGRDSAVRPVVEARLNPA